MQDMLFIMEGQVNQTWHLEKKVSVSSHKICEICYLLWRFFLHYLTFNVTFVYYILIGSYLEWINTPKQERVM